MPKVIYHPGGNYTHPSGTTYSHPAGWYYLAPTYYISNGPEEHLYSGRKSGFISEKEAQVGLERHMKHVHWSSLWQKALTNMPKRIRYKTTSHWVELPKGTTTIPDFIVGVATGEMMIQNGVPHALVTETKEIVYGQQSALTRLILNKPNVGSMDHNMVSHGINHGNRPKDTKRRELLELLASDKGAEIALKMLTEMGKAHLYKYWPKRSRNKKIG